MALTDAIASHESGGLTDLGQPCDHLRGGSGEVGCMQYMPGTWSWLSKQILGYEAPPTYINQMYVTAHKIQELLDQGYSERQIALWYNSGRFAGCSEGVNQHGVKYNSCSYVELVMHEYGQRV